jgi:hypothetical protein
MLQRNTKTTINDNEQENVLKCKITKEIKLQETKENNIIISGVPKPTLDVDAYIKDIDVSEVISDINKIFPDKPVKYAKSIRVCVSH